MALKILKFGDKEIAVNISDSATEKLVDAGVCVEGSVTNDFLLDELKKGFLLIPHNSGIRMQKIKTLKTRGECITIDDVSIPLTTVRDIAEYVRTGESSGGVIKRASRQKTVVTFIEDFLDIKEGQKMILKYSTISTKYGDLKVAALVKDGIVEKNREDTHEARFKIDHYSYNNEYTVKVNNGDVSIGCKSFKTSYMKRLGKILNIYLNGSLDEYDWVKDKNV